ncbi:MAG: cytochrome c family protein [Rhizobiaceae bacterium]|nr:cytochrome c family protein [Rhizobiaceae bacterium]
MFQTKTIIKTIAAAGFLALSTGASFAEGDPVAGEAVFKKCSSCHMIGPDAKNKVGPALTGIIGMTAGTVEGYKYGKDLVAAGAAGLVWTDDEVFEYLKDPKKYLRAKLDNKKAKSKMSFKLKKEDQRKDVIAYLKTFSPEAEEGEAAESESTTTN